MKKLLTIILTLALFVTCLAGCGQKPVDDNNSSGSLKAGHIDMYVLSGPTGIGAANLISAAKDGKTTNTYTFTVAQNNTDIVAAVSNGSADIAAVATNQASALYNRTNGNVTVLAVNTASVLYMLTNGEDISTISDLKGKTIYTPGQGANPEYILRYVLKGNGIDPDKDVKIQFVSDGNELPTVWAKDPDAVIMAPQPVATVLPTKYENAKTVFNMGEEWSKISDTNALLMGCVIVNNTFLAENPDAVKIFLSEYEASINSAKTDPQTTAAICEENKILPVKAAVIAKAIPNCGLTFITGQEMKTKLSGYLNIMFEANPASVGGKLPADGFYYVK